jgi:hypothetical protein
MKVRISRACGCSDLRCAHIGSGVWSRVDGGGANFEEGPAVRMRQRYLILGLAAALMPVGVTVASPASADCTSAGAATVCAQGTVRGGGPSAPTAGPAYPSYCADPWYCDYGWDMDVIIGRPGGGIDIGRPGGGGGIGPR